MKTIRSTIAIMLAAAACAFAQTSESVDQKASIAGTAVDPANDFTLVRDASVTSGPALKKLSLDEFIDIPGFFGAVSKSELLYLDGVTGSIQTQLDGKQATLVSGTNIKTLNGSSLLGSGNLALTSDLTSGPVRSTGGTSTIAADQITPTMLATGIPSTKIAGLGTAATAAATDFAGKSTTFLAKKAMGGLGFLSQPNVSDTITIGSVTYTFVSGTPAAPNQVQIAATSILTGLNLRNAITSGSGGGVTHPLFASTTANGVVGILAKTAGAAGNGIGITTNAAARINVYQAATYGGADAVQTISLADKFRDDHSYSNPLVIPTPDGLPAVTHPSVVFHPDGWNGYRYWMAFTPWPDGSREFPNIIASQNGVDWEVPAGLVNPLVSTSTVTSTPSGGASNFGFAPDTHLVMLDDNTMAVFFLMSWATTAPAQDSAMFRMTSTNGSTWGNLTRVIDTTANGRNAAHGITSPAVYKLPDGTWELLGVTEFDGSRNRISRWTSPDTTTWTWQEQVFIPSGTMEPWHIDATYVSGRRHLLVNGVGARLHYFYSTDGSNYIGDATNPAPELLSGDAWDAGRNYRSCIVPRYGNPLKWDVWASGLPAAPIDGVQTGGAPWNIGLFRGVEFRDPAPAPQEQNKRWLMPLVTGMTYAVGTGSSAALVEGSVFRLNQGSTAAGYALARLSRRTDSRESTNTNYSQPFEITGKIMGGASAGTKIRILYGHALGMDTGFTANAGTNPFAEKGIGLEFGTDATNQKARLIYHNGTSTQESAWIDMGTTIHHVRVYGFRLVNYGDGVIELFAASGTATVNPKIVLPSTPSARVTNGPTGTGPTANNSAIWAVVTGDGTTTPGTAQCEFEAPVLEWK